MASNLCDNCKDKIFKSILGYCSKCGNPTSYSAYQLCGRCSKEAKVCQVCLVPKP